MTDYSIETSNMAYKKVYNRRNFIGTAASSAFALTYLPSRVFGANSTIQMAGIGVGGKGGSDIDGAGKVGKVVALCDIDGNNLNEKSKKYPGAKKFFDFREMLSSMKGEIDAVTVSTPDHTHAPAALMAMRQGVHVYCQKPLTHTVAEARAMRVEALKNGVATQMGNQGTADNGLRRGVELVQSGIVGDVQEIHVWTNRPVWPQAPEIVGRPNEAPPIPPHIRWDQFIGPAPWRPYHSAYHPFKWRGWWDFGTGALGDMGCHTANMAFMACKLKYPTKVKAISGEVNSETYPAWASVEYDFPAREKMPACKFYWYEGKLPNGEKNLPPKALFNGENPPGSGSLIVGTEGILYSPNDYGSKFKIFPKNKTKSFVQPKAWLPRNGRGDDGMKEEWAAAIKGGPPAMSNFEYAGVLTEAILLGNVAILHGGKTLDWNGQAMKFTNSDSANDSLHKKFRHGWPNIRA